MRCVLLFVFVLFVSVDSGSSECSHDELPCENGECVDSVSWCDAAEDCADGTDEKYCKRTSLFNKDPNKCPSTYFKCVDGPCIPMAGRCDGYNQCRDSSDERNCQLMDSSTQNGSKSPAFRHDITQLNTQTTGATTMTDAATKTSTASTYIETTRDTNQQILVKVEEYDSSFLSDSSDALHHSFQLQYSDLQPSDYSHQREKARDWLLSQRRYDFGWGDETPRVITALYLSDVGRSSRKNESDMLMVKQLEVLLSLDMARNGTQAVKLTDLALYINALLASCKDPKNFHGDNLVRILRNGVDAAQKDKFVNPSAYLTLCINNASSYEDARKLHDIFSSRNTALDRIDIQALALLSYTCIHQNTNYVSTSVYDSIKRQFLQRVNISGFPGNVYEASLIFQALQELKKNLPGLLEFILRHQQEDGSFGDILATYLVLPVLSGRSFLHMNDHCGQRYTTDPAPIEVLKNVKRRKIYVQYSLNYGNPPEITQTIQMKVAEGINFLDVMRLAQEINPKYRFMLDGNRDIPVVYSIGGIPNDAEKGMFWTLHLTSSGNAGAGRLSPYSGNIKQLIPRAGDEFVFWMKSI